jgi:hypothetical protein
MAAISLRKGNNVRQNCVTCTNWTGPRSLTVEGWVRIELLASGACAHQGSDPIPRPFRTVCDLWLLCPELDETQQPAAPSACPPGDPGKPTV